MFFNEPDYVTVHSVLNIMTANGATITAQKNATIMLLILFEKRYYRRTMTNAAVWLSCYMYIFAI